MSPETYLIVGVGVFGFLALAALFWRNARAQQGQGAVQARALETELRRQLEQREAELDQLRSALTTSSGQNGELTARLRGMEEALVAERSQIEAIQEKFHKEFEAVSNKLLMANRSEFSRQSSESLEALLKPLKDELKDFKTKLDVTQLESAKHNVLLKDQIGRIGTEAANLTKALKGDAKLLGNWGENMLDQILQKSGLQEGVHYRRQQSGRSEEGDRRFLDVIIDLPDNKHLVIDSKVSLKCYEEHMNAADEPLRLKSLGDHLGCVRKHVHGLGAKRYHEIYGINSPDFVLMYIPIEAAFFVAMANDAGLFSEALERNVVLTTNSTLLATLRTAASVWRLADQQKNALEVAKRGGQLYDKFVGFVTDMEAVGSSLRKSQEAWEAASNKLHTGAGNLVRQVEQLKALGAKTSKAMPPEIKGRSEEHLSAAESLPDLLDPVASDPEIQR